MHAITTDPPLYSHTRQIGAGSSELFISVCVSVCLCVCPGAARPRPGSLAGKARDSTVAKKDNLDLFRNRGIRENLVAKFHKRSVESVEKVLKVLKVLKKC